MTKAELIRKISKRSGVPDSEAKIFFELFLKRASEQLKPGEAIKLEQMGYFQLRKGVIKNITTAGNEEGKNIIYADLMVYYPEDDDQEAINDNLIFNVPSENTGEHSTIDSFFSLSIGKPVIPLRGIKPTEFFNPPTGLALTKLIESKVEKLLKETKIVKQFVKGNEVLLIDAQNKNTNQIEIAWGDTPDKESKDLSHENIAEDDLTEYENVSWDFGENLSKEIEEEAILDIDKEPDSFSDFDNDVSKLSWDFGDEETESFKGAPPDESVTNNDVDSHEDSSSYTPKEDNEISDIKRDEIDDEEINLDEEKEKVFDSLSEQDMEDVDEDNMGDFQKVRSFTSEILPSMSENSRLTESDLDWDFDATRLENENSSRYPSEDGEDEIVDENGFKRVKKTTIHNFTSDETLDDKYISGSQNADLDEHDNSETEVIKASEKNDISDNSTYDGYAARLKLREMHDKKRRAPVVFLIAITTILLVSAALFFYLKDSDFLNFNKPNKPSSTVLEASTPVIINRKFDIPVTYPYAKKEGGNVTTGAITSSVFKTSKTNLKDNKEGSNLSGIPNHDNTETNKVKTSPNKAAGNTSVTIMPESRKYVKVDGNIYKVGDVYVVQVSSWKSESIAEKQAAKYKAKGFYAFIEKAEIPGRGTWYRVRVGNFDSLTLAKNFIRNKK